MDSDDTSSSFDPCGLFLLFKLVDSSDAPDPAALHFKLLVVKSLLVVGTP
jgi:hypothetical protein